MAYRYVKGGNAERTSGSKRDVEERTVRVWQTQRESSNGEGEM